MSRRKAPTSLQGQLRSLFREVRLGCDEPNKAPSVRRRVLLRYRSRLKGINGAEDHLLAKGLEAEIRAMLKDEHDADPADPTQLLLWPDPVRKLVTDINRAHVFVPGRGEFVDLTPTQISQPEVDAAGDYLIAKGEDSIRVGGKLKLLARAWVNPSAKEYVEYCRRLIEIAFDADDLAKQWDTDEELRDKLSVPVADRIALRELLNKKLAELRRS